jgi:hypothetical protein
MYKKNGKIKHLPTTIRFDFRATVRLFGLTKILRKIATFSGIWQVCLYFFVFPENPRKLAMTDFVGLGCSKNTLNPHPKNEPQ